MNLIVLTGNKAQEEFQEFLEETPKTLSDLYDEIYTLEYNHWDTEETLVDIEQELENLVDKIDRRKSYAILAHSAGIVLAAKGINEGKLNPKYCIFLGLPLTWAEVNDFDMHKIFKGFDVPTLYGQKSRDPAGHFDDAEKFLKEAEVENSLVVKMTGRDHYYKDQEQNREFIDENLDDLKELAGVE